MPCGLVQRISETCLGDMAFLRFNSVTSMRLLGSGSFATVTVYWYATTAMVWPTRSFRINLLASEVGPLPTADQQY